MYQRLQNTLHGKKALSFKQPQTHALKLKNAWRILSLALLQPSRASEKREAQINDPLSSHQARNVCKKAWLNIHTGCCAKIGWTMLRR